MCLAQGHNTVTPVRLEPVAHWSRVKHSPTEPLIPIDSLNEKVWILISWFQQLPADQALHCFQKRVWYFEKLSCQIWLFTLTNSQTYT